MSTQQGDQIPFIPPNIPRSTRKEGAVAMMPFQHHGKTLFLSIQIEQSEDDGIVVSLDLEESFASANWNENENGGTHIRAQTSEREHFCALKLNPDRIFTAKNKPRIVKPVVPPEVL